MRKALPENFVAGLLSSLECRVVFSVPAFGLNKDQKVKRKEAPSYSKVEEIQ